MLKVFNETCRYVNQSSKRKGSIAIYLEPWHADVLEYLNLRRHQGEESTKCRDLYFALYVNDLFMKRVENGENWSLFCPNDVNLVDYHGEQFEEKYIEAEKKGLYRKQIKARELYDIICATQIETSQPYFVYKDRINKSCN